MKSKLIYAALGALTMSAPAVAQQNPKIYGSVVFGHLWEDMGDETPYGLYSVPSDNGDAVQLEVRSNDIKANGGGVYVDGMYYLVDFTRYNLDRTVTFRTFDVNNGWKLVNEQSIKTYSNVASDLAYDPTTDKIYGCFKETPESTQYFFGTLNPNTGLASKIGNIKEELIALAANREGKVYGIGLYGMLYSVNKETGALTEIGQTGKTVKYAQSATFDYASGRMFWAMTPHYTNEAPEICEVNLNDGSVKTLATIPNRYEFTGIYTLSSYAADGAPAVATAFSHDYKNGSLSGNITFKAPNTTMKGAALNGNLSYSLYIDNVKTPTTGNAAAGSAVSVSKSLQRGMHYLKVSTSNAVGRSPWAYHYFWAGTDEVKAEGPVAMLQNDAVHILWMSPSKGVHNGYFDPNDVTYTVMRQPDNVQIYSGKNTECSDTGAASLQFGNYYYEVSATTGGFTGETVRTDEIQIGSTLHLPYLQDFNNESGANTMFIEDTNNDGETWAFFGDCMYCGSSEMGLDDDDWLITPAFQLSADKVYQVSIDAYGDEGYIKKLEIAAGKARSSQSMTQTIMPATVLASDEYKTYTSEFVPENDGLTYIGLHACSPYDMSSSLTIDNLAVKEMGSVLIPSAATNISAKGVGSEKRVTISLLAPTTDMKGNALGENLTRLTVYNTTDQKLVKEFTDVAPGQSLTMEDTPANDGVVEYSVVAANRHGEGKRIYFSTFVGFDKPGAITDAKVSATDDGKVQLTWSAPTVGINGGNIDVASLKYTVGNLDGSSLRNTVTTATSYSEQLTMKEGEQRLAWYVITPETAQGKGVESSSDTVFVGKPYALPFFESFAKRSLQRGPWNTTKSELARWDIMQFGTYADPADADNGLIAFSTMTDGETADFISPKLTLRGSTNPTLKFSIYHEKNCSHTLEVLLLTPSTLNPQPSTLNSQRLALITPNDTEGTGIEGEWREESLDLSDYVQADYVQLVLRGIGGTPEDIAATVPLYVDAVSITDPLTANLAVAEFSTATTKTTVGEDVKFSVKVLNNGVTAAEDYTVRLLRDGATVSEKKGSRLDAETWTAFTLTDAPNSDAKQTSRYTAEIVWDKDGDATDNTSKETVVSVLPGKPYIKSALAQKTESEGSVLLTWSEPQHILDGTKAESVTEDFESYAAFTIEHFGEWTLLDGDQKTTIGIQDGSGDFVQYDNVEAPMAFQVFNPSAANLNSFYFPTHSGNQVAAAFTVGRYAANDDWLISPAVDGAQTIRFWALSPDANYYGTNEKVEVLYSTTGTAKSDFKKIGSTLTVPGTWKEYTAVLPAGTRHFALRCVSQDQYILFLDDISYRKAGREFSLLGYNVYRNGTLLTPAPIAATSYVDQSGMEEGEYSVSAVYNIGESRQTLAVWGDATAIGIAPTHPHNGDNAVYDLGGRRLKGEALSHKGVVIKNGKKTLQP